MSLQWFKHVYYYGVKYFLFKNLLKYFIFNINTSKLLKNTKQINLIFL